MKKTNLYILLIFLVVAACGARKENKEGMKALQGVSDMVSNADNVAERQEKLSDMSPLSAEQFMSWAPKSVMGLPMKESTEKALSFDTYKYSGYATTYQSDDKTLRLDIYDGAGSTIYSRYASMLSTDAMNEERENYYEKNVERDGKMVNEWHDSKRNDCALLFIHNNRFVVSIKGEGFNPDEIWKNLEDFKLDEL